MATIEPRSVGSAVLAAAVVLSALVGTAAAQSATGDGREVPSPLQSEAPVPPLRYESVLRDYQRGDGQALLPWWDVNEVVRRVGGHAGALRGETRGAAVPPPSASGQGEGPSSPPPGGAAASPPAK